MLAWADEVEVYAAILLIPERDAIPTERAVDDEGSLEMEKLFALLNRGGKKRLARLKGCPIRPWKRSMR